MALTEAYRKQLGDKSNELKVHFVEDRFETLLAVAEVPELSHVSLYLVGTFNISI